MKSIKLALLITTTFSFIVQSEILSLDSFYQYKIEHPIDVKLTTQGNRHYEFSFISFDGELVYGHMSYPEKEEKLYPVLLGLHAMGRSSQRWWKDSINGRKTITQVDKLGEMADRLGYVVIALDARFHGKRKDPAMTITNIMESLHKNDNPIPYRHMIMDTVKDYRVLLDWIENQPTLDSNNVQVAGYSMGAQQALLLAGVDERIKDVLAIVPPFVDDKKLLSISPMEFTSSLADNPIMLITADADEYASTLQNSLLFKAIASTNKSWQEVVGGHILPEHYLTHLEHWFIANK